MARRRRIAFVEEPIFLHNGEAPRLAVREADGITVAQPHVPAQEQSLPQVSASNQEIVRGLVGPFLTENRFTRGIRWHYAPMARYLADLCGSPTVVYDCMDELSAFKGAPTELVLRERELMAEAHVMFTGGLSMWLNKREFHPNCYRFDSGVDLEHFGKATRKDTPIPEDVRHLTGPVLGYYGVIDERMDYEALRANAAALPVVTLLLVGPVTKVDPADLPRAQNILYTYDVDKAKGGIPDWDCGKRAYKELPGYLKRFDVALVPFADNEATRFLSPTKTLEYFAGMKPVVSSPVKDVVENYSDVVRLARSPGEYVAAAQDALAAENTARARRALAKAQEKTWDAIVGQMEDLVGEAEARATHKVVTLKVRPVLPVPRPAVPAGAPGRLAA